MVTLYMCKLFFCAYFKTNISAIFTTKEKAYEEDMVGY